MRFFSKKTVYRISLVFLLFSLLCLTYYMHVHMSMLLNSDDASELVLSKLLADQKQILSKDWFYSTELRFLNTQLIYAPFFLLFESWHAVRIGSLFVMYLILIAGALYFSRQAGLRAYFPLVALLFILPVSKDYFQFVLRPAYYIPHIVINLFQLGMMYHYLNADKGSRVRKVLLPAAFILALLAGAGGARQLVILYLPLLLGFVVLTLVSLYSVPYAEKIGPHYRSLLIYVCTAFAGSAAGYVLNTRILSGIYDFMQWDSIDFTAFSAENFFGVLNGLLTSSGYRTGALGLGTIVPNAFAMVFLAAGLFSMVYGIVRYKTVSKEFHLLAVFYASFLVVFTVLYCFTDMSYRSRYNLPAHIFAFILIICWIRESKPRFKIRPLLLTGYALMLLACSAVTCRFYADIDQTSEFREIADYLTAEGYAYGYGTFWNSNILTELSDGQLKMHVWLNGDWTDQMHNLKDVDYAMQWLQRKENTSFIPPGKLFAIFSNKEVSDLTCWKENIESLTPVYSTDNFIVLRFRDHDEMKALLEKGIEQD